jgi:hypothetical protein
MGSSASSPVKRGRKEDDDDESCHRRKLEKRMEPVTKDTDEEPFVNKTKFVIDLLRSAFRKLQYVGKAFDIKAPHEVDKDPSVKGLAFRIHGLVEKLENLPVVKRASGHFVFDSDGSDGGDSSGGTHGGTPMAATD